MIKREEDEEYPSYQDKEHGGDESMEQNRMAENGDTSTNQSFETDHESSEGNDHLTNPGPESSENKSELSGNLKTDECFSTSEEVEKDEATERKSLLLNVLQSMPRNWMQIEKLKMRQRQILQKQVIWDSFSETDEAANKGVNMKNNTAEGYKSVEKVVERRERSKEQVTDDSDTERENNNKELIVDKNNNAAERHQVDKDSSNSSAGDFIAEYDDITSDSKDYIDQYDDISDSGNCFMDHYNEKYKGGENSRDFIHRTLECKDNCEVLDYNDHSDVSHAGKDDAVDHRNSYDESSDSKDSPSGKYYMGNYDEDRYNADDEEGALYIVEKADSLSESGNNDDINNNARSMKKIIPDKQKVEKLNQTVSSYRVMQAKKKSEREKKIVTPRKFGNVAENVMSPDLCSLNVSEINHYVLSAIGNRQYGSDQEKEPTKKKRKPEAYTVSNSKYNSATLMKSKSDGQLKIELSSSADTQTERTKKTDPYIPEDDKTIIKDLNYCSSENSLIASVVPDNVEQATSCFGNVCQSNIKTENVTVCSGMGRPLAYADLHENLRGPNFNRKQTFVLSEEAKQKLEILRTQNQFIDTTEKLREMKQKASVTRKEYGRRKRLYDYMKTKFSDVSSDTSRAIVKHQTNGMPRGSIVETGQVSSLPSEVRLSLESTDSDMRNGPYQQSFDVRCTPYIDNQLGTIDLGKKDQRTKVSTIDQTHEGMKYLKFVSF